MSKFSGYLKELIKNSGETISAVARSIGVERTSIHKALSDERVLSYKAVRSLAQHFHLPVDQRREFFRLYDILLQGEEVYENRQAVSQLLNNLSEIRFSMAAPPEVPALQLTDRLIKGEYAVHSAIRSVLIYEASHNRDLEINMLLPEKLDLTMELMELWLDNRVFCVNQLLCFHTANPSSARKNIEMLGTVIPLCLASRGRYKPYYYPKAPQAVVMSPMSYYIITPNYLILMAEDLSAAQIRTGELVGFYDRFFKNIVQNCDLLVQCSSNILEVLQEYITNTDPDIFQIMMAQPCPGRYITRQVIEKYLYSGAMPYDQMLELVDRHFSVLRQIQKNYLTVFTEKGLQNLLDTCVLQDLPPQYTPPMEKADILQMLSALYEEIEKESISGFITRPEKLQFPDYLAFHINPTTGVHIYTTNAFVFGAYCCNIHIAEKSICEIFLDFLQSLPESAMVYSREETLQLLDKYLENRD